MTITDVNKTTTGSEVDENGNPITTLKPGEKTDPALLLQSLQEEREKRRIAEEEKKKIEAEKSALEFQLKALKNNPDSFSDEGKILNDKVSSLEDKIVLKDLVIAFPALLDKTTEFEEFRKGYPGIEIGKVAKLFLSENGLLEPPKERKGLERVSGGGRQPIEPTWTPEKIDELRVTNYRAYVAELKKGTFKNLS